MIQKCTIFVFHEFVVKEEEAAGILISNFILIKSEWFADINYAAYNATWNFLSLSLALFLSLCIK